MEKAETLILRFCFFVFHDSVLPESIFLILQKNCLFLLHTEGTASLPEHLPKRFLLPLRYPDLLPPGHTHNHIHRIHTSSYYVSPFKNHFIDMLLTSYRWHRLLRKDVCSFYKHFLLPAHLPYNPHIHQPNH